MSKKISVKNSALRMIMLCGERKKTLSLNPGSNLIDEAKYKEFSKAINKHDSLSTMKEDNGALTDASNIAELSIPKASEVIVNCYDEDLLATFKVQEMGGKNRPKIIGAIEKQLEVIASSVTPKS